MPLSTMIDEYQKTKDQMCVAIEASDQDIVMALDKSWSLQFLLILEAAPTDRDDAVCKMAFLLEYMRPSSEDTELSKQIRSKLPELIGNRFD